MNKKFVTPDAIRKRVRDYNNSKAGLKVRAEYKKRNLERIKEYNRLYHEKRVARAKLLGLCIVCLRPKQQRDKVSCNSCLKKIANNARKSKEIINCQVKGCDRKATHKVKHNNKLLNEVLSEQSHEL
jgi:hypothetical protein